ncbi:hypothetical protein [Paracoccus salipaludis]|nr:hypothetical protein [Paracoccus salipaludis]
MTTPGEMVKQAAAALGVPEITLTQIDRELAANGLRAKGGRGRSAAKMDSGDVTNLLIGAASGAIIRETAETVRTYAHLSGNPARKWGLEGFSLPTVQALPENHTFGQALNAFVASAAAGEFKNAYDALPKKEVQGRVIPQLYQAEFRLHGPSPQAVIRLFVGGKFNEEHHYNAGPQEGDDIMAWAERYQREFERKGYGDLSRVYYFTDSTIKKMGQFLRGEG